MDIILRSPTTAEWGIKRGAKKGHRAGVSARWKKMIKDIRRGENFRREADPQSAALSVAQKWEKFMSKQGGCWWWPPREALTAMKAETVFTLPLHFRKPC